MRTTIPIIGLALSGVLAAALTASAHVVLTERTAHPGAYYVATLRVPHGCAGSATKALRVQIPPEINSARPMPKPGWRVEVIHEPLAQPVTAEGRVLTRRVKEVVWHDGVLPDEQFDEFSISLRLPDHTGPVYFPVVQVCEVGQSDWVEVPRDGQAVRDLHYPAPSVVLGLTQP
jgi:uncharacterized protein YcnI